MAPRPAPPPLTRLLALAALLSAASGSAPEAELPDFEAPIGNQTVAAGRDAQLTCRVNGRLGAYRTAWLRVEDKGILTIHNNVITRNYRIGLANTDDGRTFTLTIRSVQPSDGGGYMCQINSVPMRYAIGYLEVQTAPVFDERGPGEQALSVREGANATLACRAQGQPAPAISWRREDNEPLGAGSSALGPLLQLSQLGRAQAGAYLCIASNGVPPAASRRLLLEVQFAPSVRAAQAEQAARLGAAEVRLACHVEANPGASCAWLAQRAAGQEQELAAGDKFDIVIAQVARERLECALVVRRLERADLGAYRCVARNQLGAGWAALRLLEEPAAPGAPFALLDGRPAPPASGRPHARSPAKQASSSTAAASNAPAQASAAPGPARAGWVPLAAALVLLARAAAALRHAAT